MGADDLFEPRDLNSRDWVAFPVHILLVGEFVLLVGTILSVIFDASLPRIKRFWAEYIVGWAWPCLYRHGILVLIIGIALSAMLQYAFRLMTATPDIGEVIPSSLIAGPDPAYNTISTSPTDISEVIPSSLTTGPDPDYDTTSAFPIIQDILARTERHAGSLAVAWPAVEPIFAELKSATMEVGMTRQSASQAEGKLKKVVIEQKPGVEYGSKENAVVEAAVKKFTDRCGQYKHAHSNFVAAGNQFCGLLVTIDSDVRADQEVPNRDDSRRPSENPAQVVLTASLRNVTDTTTQMKTDADLLRLVLDDPCDSKILEAARTGRLRDLAAQWT